MSQLDESFLLNATVVDTFLPSKEPLVSLMEGHGTHLAVCKDLLKAASETIYHGCITAKCSCLFTGCVWN